jgi:hypothetical protein
MGRAAPVRQFQKGRFMLKPANQNAKYCYERSLAAGEKVANARNAADREFWLDRERQWLKFATYYEHSERLTAFIGGFRSTPKQPICVCCEVPMRIRQLHCHSNRSTEYSYECPACEAKQRIVHVDAEPPLS